jgi:hypothetical protein
MQDGETPIFKRCTILEIITFVLPEPGPAETKTAPY